MSSSEKTCPQCGNVIPKASATGTCPRCLMSLGFFADEPVGGKRVGDYVLGEMIGRGGMGVVYRARHANLGRDVALKMIVGGELASREDLRRFRVEAEAAADLHHPNVVPIFDVGEADGMPFYTMRFVEGSDLASDMASFVPGGDPGKAKVLQEKSASLLSTIARAVDHAHQHGVLHRDLKPTNVLIDEAGEPLLADFGLAKRLQEEHAAITMSSSALGSPSYMAPEQSTGDSTIASDVWSLGAILYEMLVGEPPFRGQSPMDTLRKVIDEAPVPPRRLDPTLSRDLETICLKCLEKEPARRYASALELADELDRYARGEPVLARPVSDSVHFWRWCRRNPVPASLGAALLLVLAVGVSGIVSQWLRAERANTELSATVSHLEWRRLRNLEEQGQTGQALAELAAVLREDPENRNAAAYALSLLEERRFPIPTGGPFSGVERKRLRDLCRDEAGERIYYHEGGAEIFVRDGYHGELVDTLTLESTVDKLAINRSGSKVAAALADGTLCLIDLKKPEQPPATHPVGPVSTLLFDRDDLFVASGDSLSRFRNSAGPDEIVTLSLDAPIASLETSRPPGKLLASTPKEVSLIDPESMEVVRSFAMDSPPRKIAYSGAAETLVTLANQLVTAHSSLSEKPATFPERKTQTWIGDFTLSPDGEMLAVGSHFGEVKRWHLPSKRMISSTPLHRLRVRSVQFDDRGEKLLTGSDDATALLLDAQSGAALGEPMRHRSFVYEASFLSGASPGGASRILTAQSGLDSEWLYQTWRIPERESRPVISRDEVGWIASVSLGHGGRWMAVSGGETGLSVFERKNDRYSLAFKRPQLGYGLFFHPTEPLLFSVSDSGALARHQLPDGEISGEAVETGLKASASQLCPAGELMLFGSARGEYQMWDVSGGTPPTLLWKHKHRGRVSSAVFSSDGEKILTASNDATAALREARTGRLITEFVGHEKKIIHATISGDGRKVVTASYDHSARIWDAVSGKEVVPPLRHRNQVVAVAFSPDDRLVASGSRGGEVVLWDVITGKAVVGTMQENHGVRRVFFSSDGRRLIVASQGGVRQWNVATGEPVTTLLRQNQIDGLGFLGSDVAFLPDEDSLLFGANAVDAVFYDLSLPKVAAPAWFPPFLEAVAGQRTADDGSMVPVDFQEARTLLQRPGYGTEDTAFSRMASSVLGEE